ncbi:hypothetical protein L198_01620 [Cryptococcus wingfieldii CBS 7118]|uniref:Uncharacterized protein n=1 Tax=Cryptococcus wingfieldii CBS 7118 TaxID=1295528 RepID=A0A1E3JZS7_9TREE|nr:hypothetical protein L198_01620 [Cryptococcus wingfieldii CBS 7118]ODO06388.1 hypothetical protein L198_01620 [Cryptococcus wingfieldii CBS 7118]
MEDDTLKESQQSQSPPPPILQDDGNSHTLTEEPMEIDEDAPTEPAESAEEDPFDQDEIKYMSTGSAVMRELEREMAIMYGSLGVHPQTDKAASSRSARMTPPQRHGSATSSTAVASPTARRRLQIITGSMTGTGASGSPESPQSFRGRAPRRRGSPLVQVQSMQAFPATPESDAGGPGIEAENQESPSSEDQASKEGSPSL